MLKAYIAFSFAAFLLLASCSETSEPKIVFEGITKRAANGELIQNDPDDWKPVGNITGLSFMPNPLILKDGADGSLLISLKDKAVCTFRLTDNKNVNLTIYKDIELTAGAHPMLFPSDGLSPGIYRLYITADKKTTYGDIEIK